MQVRLKQAIQKSHRIRFLSAITLALSIFSITLYLPDLLYVLSNKKEHTETLEHEYVHIILSLILAIVSWFSFHSHQTQKQIFSIIEALPHSVLLFSRHGRLITANLSGRNFIKERHGIETITYKNFIEHICLQNIHQKDSLHHINNPLLKSIKTKDSIFQDVYKVQNGEIFLIQCQEIDSNIKFVLITNITQIYDLNKESHTLLTAVNLSPTGFALASPINGEFQVFYFNNAYQILSGLNQCLDSLSKHIISIATPAEWMHTDNAIKNGIPHQFQSKIEEKNEAPRWLLYQLFPIKQNDQDMILIYLKDITKQIIQDNQSQQSIRLETIGHLSSGIAHDFNNILSIIKGYQQLSIKEGLDRKSFLEYNAHIETAIQRASLLTRQLLSFGDNKIILKGKTNLIVQMNELEKLLKTLVHGSAQLEFLIPHDLQVQVSCPVDIFTQIIMNLVINARDALPHGGTISVSAHMIDQIEYEQLPREIKKDETAFVCLQVHDNGTGIKPEHIPHIFDPFFTTKDVDKGTGLGLSLIYKHLKNLNGHIKVSSVYGEGTTMSVYIPILEEHDTDLSIKSIIQQDTTILRGKRIILVDDEANIRHILRTMLEEWGCEVYEADDGNAALSIQDDLDHVDILLTDIMMPNMNGLHLAHMFEEIRPQTKVIFLSGYPRSNENSKFRVPEDAIFLAKPISNESLKQAILSTLMTGDPSHERTAVA